MDGVGGGRGHSSSIKAFSRKPAIKQRIAASKGSGLLASVLAGGRHRRFGVFNDVETLLNNFVGAKSEFILFHYLSRYLLLEWSFVVSVYHSLANKQLQINYRALEKSGTTLIKF